MRLSPQFVMLAVFGISGSVLYAAEEYRLAQERKAAAAQAAVAMAPQAEVDKDKKVTDAAQPADAKTDAGKDDAAKASKDSPAGQTADATADKAAPDTAAPDKGAATAQNGQNGKSSKTDADRAASPQRFVPSEEVRADFDVSFPVDI